MDQAVSTILFAFLANDRPNQTDKTLGGLTAIKRKRLLDALQRPQNEIGKCGCEGDSASKIGYWKMIVTSTNCFGPCAGKNRIRTDGM